jgi:CheY-like chemotaxis protein
MIMRRKGNAPLFLLIDDDEHSAYFFNKTTRALDKDVGVEWIADCAGAEAMVGGLAIHPGRDRPDLIIVDLKANSQATANFIARIRKPAAALGVPIVAMAISLERTVRETMLQRGAAAVFERSPDLQTYRGEVQAIIDLAIRLHTPNQQRAVVER